MAGRVFAFLLLAGLLHILRVSGDSTECRLCESLLTDSDHCTFLLDESTENPPWNCPLVFPCGKIIAINYTFIANFNALNLQRVNKCFKFIIATQNFSRYSDFFSGSDKFVPYTKIILLESGTEEAFNFTAAQINHMYINALHVLQNEINVSLFHCPPFVVDKEPDNIDRNSTLNLKRFDGVEFRLMTYITNRWKRRIFVRNPTPDTGDSWDEILMDLTQQRSQVAMCALWLIEKTDTNFDLSWPYEQQCITLLVPRGRRIPRNRYIYLAMNERVWTLYLILTLFICLLVYFLITFNTNNSLALQFNLLIESTMKVLSIATQHGVTRFPRRFSAKILLISWFFFCLLITAIYSTGLTSILTTSLFHKPIDRVRHVINKQLKWGDTFGTYLHAELLKSGSPQYANLADLLIDPDSEETEQLIEARKYAQVVAVLSTKFIVGADRFENISARYRLMDSCIYKFYTVFAFQKNSPYAPFFSQEVSKCVESGLIHYWMKLANVQFGKRYTYSFFVKTKDIYSGPHTFTVDNLSTGLYIWAIGLFLATVVFLIELWLHWQKKLEIPRILREN
ncbi:uncharacterized protein LOC132264521 [Phlebotomus argentipes]|uniref:uncharacterized protein LOC132257773 n=1 Tax=Phlebotomus argentipes TaxID=94469 RepID=UPI002892E522|nr:uncharacterized protein LOC132257773 [Phlebotomus argentipes]XP_059620738.1 uncharacterized protein LOC132264521 [Phlebotomus argentipes]